MTFSAISPVYYHLPVLIVLVSLVYSATRYDDWPSILHEAFRWGIRMAGFLAAIGAVMWGLAEFFI